MKFSEIERLFSQKVAEYLVKGYTIDVQTIRTYGREIGKVDLRNDRSVVRVAVEKRCSFSDGKLSDYYYERIAFRVSEMPCIRNDKKPCDYTECYPDSAFTVLEETEWVCLSDTWFVTKEEAEKLLVKKQERSIRKYYEDQRNRQFLSWRSSDLLVKIARRYKGLKTVTFGDVIGYVIHEPYHDWDGDHEAGYYIRARNKEIKIL